MKVYTPRLHEYYEDTMIHLRENDPRLRPLFDKNIFAATTFNLGPQVVTYEHLDNLNLPAGLCTITTIGDYDSEQGDHVLLWDLKLMIEFPPGMLILISSAMLRHSNTTIEKLKHRYSFTQYLAGSLFRWVECGFKTLESFRKEGGTFDYDVHDRWDRGISMFSTWGEL
ncbi:hypothetical protein C8Q78DRAFT_943223, partial [Trametes maxima]